MGGCGEENGLLGAANGVTEGVPVDVRMLLAGTDGPSS